MNNVIQLLFGGTRGEEEVSFAEMEMPPQVTVHADHLEICVWNSLRDSSMGIHQLRFRREDNTLFFTGHQRVMTSSRNPSRFELAFAELGVDPGRLADYSLLWLDPDGRTTPLAPHILMI